MVAGEIFMKYTDENFPFLLGQRTADVYVIVINRNTAAEPCMDTRFCRINTLYFVRQLTERRGPYYNISEN